MSTPWKRVESELVYDDEHTPLRRDTVIQPDGQQGYYHYLDKRDFVAVVPLADDGQTFLVQQWRYPVGQATWEFPMGATVSGETPLAAAQRELEEEAGWRAAQWEEIGFAYLAAGLTNQGYKVFFARQLTPGQQRLDPTEADLTVHAVPIQEVQAMVRRGEVNNATTIVALHLLLSKHPEYLA